MSVRIHDFNLLKTDLLYAMVGRKARDHAKDIMALTLGERQPAPRLDDFLAVEGYLKRRRSYQPVTGCWCGGRRLASLSEMSAGFADYQLCSNCGCLLLKKVLAPEYFGELYGSRYFREHQAAISLPPLNQRYENDADDRIPVWMEMVRKYLSRGRVLEIGSSHGRFLEELALAGYQVVGLELEEEICAWSREKTGCDIRNISIDKMGGDSFDLLFAGDVLEHVYNPKEFVREVVRVLRPRGWALLQTVVFSHWQECPAGMLRPLFHPVLFSRKSLKLLAGGSSWLTEVLPGVFDCSVIVFRRKQF